jgi:hypothetical protein
MGGGGDPSRRPLQAALNYSSARKLATMSQQTIISLSSDLGGAWRRSRRRRCWPALMVMVAAAVARLGRFMAGRVACFGGRTDANRTTTTTTSRLERRQWAAGRARLIADV